MSLERRFGVSLFVLALGNAMLALGNFVADGSIYLVVFEVVAALGLVLLAYTFVYGNSEFAVTDSRERMIAYTTVLIAAVGVILALVGFAMAIVL